MSVSMKDPELVTLHSQTHDLMEDFLDCMKSIDSLKLHFKFTNKLESHDELVGTESDCVVVGATENLHQRVTDYNSYLPFDIMDHTPENYHKITIFSGDSNCTPEDLYMIELGLLNRILSDPVLSKRSGNTLGGGEGMTAVVNTPDKVIYAIIAKHGWSQEKVRKYKTSSKTA
jgi:hypothetical protein